MLRKLSLANFKNLNKSFDLKDGINLIIAPNGSGKTNILESIFILSHGESFFSFPEVNWINFNSALFAKIQGNSADHQFEAVVSFPEQGEGSIKNLKVDGVKTQPKKFKDNFSVIFFSPNSVNLLSESPSERRKDLDILLSSYDTEYMKDSALYKKVVKSRNFILFRIKTGSGSLDELEYWNEKLISLGSSILEKRIKILEAIENKVKELSIRLFATSKDLQIKYNSLGNINNKKEFEEKIRADLDREVEYTRTMYGPHKDDIDFLSDGRLLKMYGSRGEQRLAALIYKLALYYHYKDIKPTIILLDDVMSELDEEHRIAIEKLLSEIESQIIMTSSQIEEFSDNFLKKVNQMDLS